MKKRGEKLEIARATRSTGSSIWVLNRRSQMRLLKLHRRRIADGWGPSRASSRRLAGSGAPVFSPRFFISSRQSCRQRRSAKRGLALVDAIFEVAAGLENAGVAEGPEEAVAEKLRLALFVSRDVLADEGDEIRGTLKRFRTLVASSVRHTGHIDRGSVPTRCATMRRFARPLPWIGAASSDGLRYHSGVVGCA